MITNKQKYVIWIIEKNLDIPFTGETFEEAKQFISKHIEESKQRTKELKEFQEFREELWDYYEVR